MKTYLIMDKTTADLYGTQRACNKITATYKFKQHSNHRNIKAIAYRRGQVK